MPQTQDQVKTQEFRVMVEGVADDLAAHASFAEETMVHRGWVDVEVVRRAQRQLQQALDAYQSETREAGPDLRVEYGRLPGGYGVTLCDASGDVVYLADTSAVSLDHAKLMAELLARVLGCQAAPVDPAAYASQLDAQV